jgi:hypothetical protein
MICRRFLIRSDSTLTDPHNTLQIAFGWSDFDYDNDSALCSAEHKGDYVKFPIICSQFLQIL